MTHAQHAFDDRMSTVDFDVSQRPHITVDNDVCRSCRTTECVYACPAKLFVPTSAGGVALPQRSTAGR